MYVVLPPKHKQVCDWFSAPTNRQSGSAQHSDGTLSGGARGGDSVQRGVAPTRVEVRGVHPCSRPREEEPYRRGVSHVASTAPSSSPISMQADI